MHLLIDIAGITALGVVGAIATVAFSAINPIGAALILASVVTWIKNSQDS